MIRAVIVDDEYFNRELLKMLVTRIMPSIEIIGEADNTKTALPLIERLDPDLVFIDIRMPDGSGVDLIRAYKGPRFETVFVTGNDDYVPDDYRDIAADYVLKPIDTEKLRATLALVEERITSRRKFLNGSR